MQRDLSINLVLTFVILLSGCGSETGESLRPLNYVDPLIGTAPSTTESARRSATEDKGQTFPAVGVPFGMTHWTPQTRPTEQKCISPYYYEDGEIQGIRGSHWMSGSCTQDYGSFTIMPVTGEVTTSAEEWGSAYDHSSEITTPAYYAVTLEDYGIRMEVTGTERSGIMRFTYNKSDTATILIRPNSDEGEGYVEVYPDLNAVVGYNPVHRIYQGWGEPSGFSGHFVIMFEEEFTKYGTWRDNQVESMNAVSDGDGISDVGAYVKIPMTEDNIIRVMTGTSFTGMDKALQNLDNEIPNWGFEQVRSDAESVWNRELNRVKVTGGSKQHKTIFYTALYHTMILPRVYSDHDGSYPGFARDDQVYSAEDFQYHGDFSMWDTYRAIHPLYTLILPERTLDMVKSLIAKGEQGEWMPIFPCWNNYTAAMIGDHVISPITDAYVKGIDDFDVDTAYELAYQNATETPPYDEYVDGKGRRALNSYLDHGYIPLEDSVKEAFHHREQVSRTLEYAYDDFVLAQLAEVLGKDQDYAMLIKRTENYKNVFDTTTGFVRGRSADGSWIEPFEPAEFQPYITEGTPWHYTWYVPQDIRGLINLMGGQGIFNMKLDTLFARGLYWHGNEPSHQIAYLYNWGQEPWKTQRWTREIMSMEYSNGPGGLSGNDDTGQMSAWYVFSALGMYPVCPGVPYYALSSPLFEEGVIEVGDGRTFTIRAENVSDENKYIQSATLNGEPFTRTYIWHDEMVNGGELILRMGDTPDQTWGIGNDAAPPSLSD